MAPRTFIRSFLFFLLLAGAGMFSSCSKKEFLDKKPSTDLVVPSTLDDFQALLDYDQIMRETPVLGELSADNFYLNSSYWSGLGGREKYAYIWAATDSFYGGQTTADDWNLPYQQVFYANVVLEGLKGVTRNTGNQEEWDALRGAALFIRAYAFYNVAQLFAPVYDVTTAAADPGIPLRLSSDVNTVSVRATLQTTYDTIRANLREASNLLPTTIPTLNLNRPSKPAALALLARVSLSMRAYPDAGLYADNCLQLYHELMDYNSLSTASPFPFSKPPEEVMYMSRALTGSTVLVGLINPNCLADSGLYQSYTAGDLRGSIFFSPSGPGQATLKTGYSASVFHFSGLATDEVYLVRAECFARAGDVANAMQDLNTLLQKRWVPANWAPFSAATKDVALALILSERRKELPYRGVRWTDLRRLNKEGGNIILKRVLNGQTYPLLPGAAQYILPIPPDVIALSGMKQNPR